jgi:ribonucleoside-diphosphate reductase alpha chain
MEGRNAVEPGAVHRQRQLKRLPRSSAMVSPVLTVRAPAQADLRRAQLDENARRVLDARYLRRDQQRRIVETPDELFQRVARAVADAELLLGCAGQAAYWEEQFHRLLASRDFLPNSPTLMNAGTPLGQLSACFVLPIEDSMEAIFCTLRDMALVQRTGGGTGFSFSELRPGGSTIASSGGVTPGPLAFLRIFDCATDNIRLGGKRRGANMGVLRVDHPDVLEFITAKHACNALQNFNLSVGVTDVFMDAVGRGRRYDLRDPRSGRNCGCLPAREVFRRIAESAWSTGDPGLLFVDTINRANPTPQLGEITATNPCGEVPLLAYEACNLGSINLAALVHEEKGQTEVDWARLSEVVYHAVRFLDDVIEVNRYPLPEIERVTRGNRKIGLGVMGFAELLLRLNVAYDSKEAERFARRLMRFVAGEAKRASRALAAERGAFPNWGGSALVSGGEIRNATRTAIAPTGTLSILAGTTPGIEPLFALAYRRTHVLEGQTLPELHPLVLEVLERRAPRADAILETVLETGTLRAVAGVPPEVKHLLATAHEIPSRRHLQVQAAFQRHVENSVSKTVNLPESAPIEEVERLYRRAWKLGLKGITVYRYGSRASQVLEPGLGGATPEREHASRCDPTECRL